MLQAERRNLIVEYINSHGKLIVEDIAKELNTSPMTIRRDLKYLEDNNIIKRTHGGAVLHNVLTDEMPYKQKSKKYVSEKIRIASFAVSLIREGGTIILDAGTTNMEIAKLLKDLNKVKVITTDLMIAAYLSQFKHIEIYCTGGLIEGLTGACSGSKAREFLENVYADIAFLGASAIDVELGISSPTMEKAEVKQQMIKSAEKVALVADHEKFGKKSFAKICPLSQFDYIITDTGVDEEIVKDIQRKGLKIEIV